MPAAQNQVVDGHDGLPRGVLGRLVWGLLGRRGRGRAVQRHARCEEGEGGQGGLVEVKGG